MVCMDGFISPTPTRRSTSRTRRRSTVRTFVRAPPGPRPGQPVTIGAMVGPEAFFEVKYLAHAKQMEALDVIPEVAQRFAIDFGRPSGGLVLYRTEGAETIDGARLGSGDDRVRGRRDARGRRQGRRPRHQIVPALPARRGPRGATGACRVVVLEKALAVGRGGIVSTDVHEALRHARPLQHGGRRARRALDHPRVAA